MWHVPEIPLFAGSYLCRLRKLKAAIEDTKILKVDMVQPIKRLRDANEWGRGNGNRPRRKTTGRDKSEEGCTRKTTSARADASVKKLKLRRRKQEKKSLEKWLVSNKTQHVLAA